MYQLNGRCVCVCVSVSFPYLRSYHPRCFALCVCSPVTPIAVFVFDLLCCCCADVLRHFANGGGGIGGEGGAVAVPVPRQSHKFYELLSSIASRRSDVEMAYQRSKHIRQVLALPADRTHGPVGILLDYGMPARFANFNEQRQWFDSAIRRVVRLKMDIELGQRTVKDAAHLLDLHPNVTAEDLDQLQKSTGACVRRVFMAGDRARAAVFVFLCHIHPFCSMFMLRHVFFCLHFILCVGLCV